MTITDLDEIFASTMGVFTLPMVKERGFTARQFRRWIEKRWVTRVCGRGFVRSGVAITLERRAVAATLTWPDAIVCYRTAAILQGMPLKDDGVTHVLVPDTRRSLPGVVMHRWSVRPTAVVMRNGVRLTDRETTLADCLGRCPEQEAWGMLAWMWTRDELTESELSAQLAERHHMYGIVRLRVMVGAVRRGALSIGEIALQDFLDEHGVSGWVGDFELAGHGSTIARADVCFPGRRLILEFDGQIAHNKKTRAHDRCRDRRINAAGYDVLHVTWAMLYERPGVLLKRVREMLAHAPRSPRRREIAAEVWEEILASDAEEADGGGRDVVESA